MEKEKLLATLKWLQSQIDHASHVIRDSQENQNFGRTAQYEGMREAYLQCFNWLNTPAAHY